MAREQGSSREEIGPVQSIVMAVSGGRVRAQFRAIRTAERGSEQK